jgi:hypothetical protein
MSHTPTKKSVFDRIGSTGGTSSPSSSGTTNASNKSVCLDFYLFLIKINRCIDTWFLHCLC